MRYPSLKGTDPKFRRNHRHALHGTMKALVRSTLSRYTTGTDEHCRRRLRTQRRRAPEFAQSRFHRDSGNGRSSDGYGDNLSYSKLWPRATNKHRPFRANICDRIAIKCDLQTEFIRVSDRTIRMSNVRCPSWNRNRNEKGISVYSIRALPMLIC